MSQKKEFPRAQVYPVARVVPWAPLWRVTFQDEDGKRVLDPQGRLVAETYYTLREATAQARKSVHMMRMTEKGFLR